MEGRADAGRSYEMVIIVRVSNLTRGFGWRSSLLGSDTVTP